MIEICTVQLHSVIGYSGYFTVSFEDIMLQCVDRVCIRLSSIYTVLKTVSEKFSIVLTCL